MHRLKYRKLAVISSILLLVIGGFVLYFKVQKAQGDLRPGLGVVAFNTDKSIFTTGEEAYMQLAVLDDRGQTLCSAKLTMEITSPLGEKTTFNTWDGITAKPKHLISDSGECEAENVTDLPDYFAFLRLNEVGEYKVKVTANTEKSTLSILDRFEVRESVPFDIRRTAPTRIYPFANYSMRVIIKANEDFQGVIEEQLPVSFKLIDVELKQLTKESKEPVILETTITSHKDTQTISSTVSFKAGERYKLTYIFDAPNISPMLHLLGPLSIGNFQEIRQWQIASDLVSNNGVANYGRATNSGLNYVTTFTSGTLDTEYTDTDTSASAIQFIKSVSAPTREEKFVAHQKADGRLDVLTCTTDCNAAGDWTLRATLAGMTASGNSTKRAFDIAYEQLSGEATIVFADDPTTATLYFCQWDGANWTPSTECSGGTFSPGTGNDITSFGQGITRWVRLVAYGDRLTDKRSDEMLLAVLGPYNTAGSVSVARWDGSDFVDKLNLNDPNATGPEGYATQLFDVAWESISGNGLLVYDRTSSADGVTGYRKYIPGSGWDGTPIAGPDTGGGNNTWIELASDPVSDRISIIIGDTEDDAHLYMWKEDGSTVGFTAHTKDPIDAMIESTTGKVVATAWSRFNSNAIFSFSDDRDLEQTVVCYTTADGFSNALVNNGGSASDDVDNVIYIGSPNSAEVFYLKGDILDDLTAGTWVGTTCDPISGPFNDLTVSTTITSDLSVTVDNSPPIEFWYSWDPYSPWSLNWRFYDDETSDNPSTGLNGVAENVTPTGVDAEEFIRLRMNFAELGGEAQTDTRKKLQYTSGCNPNTSETACSWTDVGDVTETSAVWRYASNGNGDPVCTACDDNTAITKGLTSSTQDGAYITYPTNTQIFYFDGSDAAASDPNNAWTNETNSDDGDTETDATNDSTSSDDQSNYIQIEGTNASGDFTIADVRARVHNGTSWGAIRTLSTPSGGWNWTKVAGLETRILLTSAGALWAYIYEDGNAGGTTLSTPSVSSSTAVSKVEIQVIASETNMDHNALAVVEYDYPLKAENVASSTTYYFRAWDVGQQSRVYRQQTATPATPCASASTCSYPSLTTSAGGAILTVVVEDGTVTYGNMDLNTSKSTLSGELNDQQDAANTGNTTEIFNIQGQNSGCPWTLSGAAGNNNYVHEFSTNTGTDWFALQTTYQELSPSVAQDATQSFDLRITTPTDSACFDQQSVDVTVQAVQG